MSKTTIALYKIWPCVMLVLRIIVILFVSIIVNYLLKLNGIAFDEVFFWSVIIVYLGYSCKKYIDATNRKYESLVRLETELFHVKNAFELNHHRIEKIKGMGVPSILHYTNYRELINVIHGIPMIDLKNDVYFLQQMLVSLNDDLSFVVGDIKSNIDKIIRDEEYKKIVWNGIDRIYAKSKKAYKLCNNCIATTKIFMNIYPPFRFIQIERVSKDKLDKWVTLQEKQMIENDEVVLF